MKKAAGWYTEELTPETAMSLLLKGVASDSEYQDYFEQRRCPRMGRYALPDICLAYPEEWEEQIMETTCHFCKKLCWPDVNGYGFSGGCRPHPNAIAPLFNGRPKPDFWYEEICNECWPTIIKFLIPLRDIDQLNLTINQLKKAINEKRTSNNRATSSDAGECRERRPQRRLGHRESHSAP